MSEKYKICLAASAGGHLIQLLRLQDSWDGHKVFWVTTSESVRAKLERSGKVYVVGESNREHPLKVLAVLFRCFKIILKEKPKVVISTGAAAGCLCCFFGKLMGAKVIWLDSITNLDHMSLSGRMVRFIADICMVQWPDLAKQNKNVEYLGAVV